MNEPSRIAEARPVRRAAQLTLALVVAVLAVTAVAGGVAEAAPPLSLSATPNPVIVPIGETSGKYDLTWSTGSNLPAEFTLSDNNGAPFPFQLAASGTVAGIPIDVGHTHTYRLSTKGQRVPLKTIVVTARHPDQSCLGTCIKDVKTTPHGTFADVKVIATAKLATYELTANKPGEPVSSAMIGWNTATWNTQLLTLDPGTDYEWILTVRDEAGNKQTRTGTFTTLKRQVTFSFDSITVTDDSDDLSEGDLEFWFNTNGVWDLSNTFEAGVDTGDTVNPGYSAVLIGGPDIVSLAVDGLDDDCDFFDGLCSYGSMPGDSMGGSNPEQDYAQAWTDVNTLVSGAGESFSAPFSMATSAYALKFSAAGTFSVTYI